MNLVVTTRERLSGVREQQNRTLIKICSYNFRKRVFFVKRVASESALENRNLSQSRITIKNMIFTSCLEEVFILSMNASEEQIRGCS